MGLFSKKKQEPEEIVEPVKRTRKWTSVMEITASNNLTNKEIYYTSNNDRGFYVNYGSNGKLLEIYQNYKEKSQEKIAILRGYSIINIVRKDFEEEYLDN